MPGIEVFQLVDGQYKIVDYIKSDDEIDKETFARIKEKYPDKPGSGESIEMKMLRIGILNPQDPSFLAYNDFVEKIRAEGKAEKQAAAEARAQLKEVELPQEESDEVKIWVRE